MRRTPSLAAGAAAALLIVWYFGLTAAPPEHRPDAPPAAKPAGSERTRPESEPAARPTPRREDPLRSTPPALPISLQGSHPDGALLVVGGELQVDLGLRRYFDWHRSAAGELDEPGIRRLLDSGMRASLPDGPRQAALDVYDRYVAYLAASEHVRYAGDPLDHFDAMRALRIELLGASLAAAFFADEELAVEARLARRHLALDPDLSESQRAARLAAFDEMLPAELKPSPELRMAEQAERLTALYGEGGTDPRERLRERRELFGDAAARRLAALDQQRADWQARVEHYHAVRQQLAQDPRLDARARQRALQDWLARQFDPAEQRRLQSLIDAGLVDGG